MKINTVTLSELESGTVFWYEQSYYMLLSDRSRYLNAKSEGDLFAVDLEDGEIHWIHEETRVRPCLNAELCEK